MTSGCGLPGQRISKKLMLRVRPGVELVRASLVPTRELMRLDLPTLERPRKATSGKVGAGNWAASVAAAMNRERTLMLKCAMGMGKLASGEIPTSRAKSAREMGHPAYAQKKRPAFAGLYQTEFDYW